MNRQDASQIHSIAQELRDLTDANSGWKGALMGGALGMFSAITAARENAQPLTPMALLAAAAVGITYGASQKASPRRV